MLESNLAPKGSPAARLCLIFMLLRLRMSPYAYDYRTCKHPCAYACAYVYAGVVSVNQALGSQGIMLLKSTSAIFFRGSILKPGLHVRRKHKHKHKHNHKKPSCKPVQRKHKHKRKEIKLKNSDKLSAYILVTHALPFAKWRQQIFMLLRLRMSPYAYAYRMCKHPCDYACAYAYACVVRVNQA